MSEVVLKPYAIYLAPAKKGMKANGDRLATLSAENRSGSKTSGFGHTSGR